MHTHSCSHDRRLGRQLYRLGAMLLTASFVGACQSDGSSPNLLAVDERVAAGQDITLAPGEAVVVAPGALSLTFVSVANESRCPVNATIQCVWGGTAAVALLATSPEGKRTLTIETQPGKDTIPIDRYQVQLVKLDPMPTTLDPIPQARYRATIRLRAR